MYQDEYKRWLAADLEDADLKPELAKVEGNDDEIKDRFAVALKFGTAGLRGVLGAGTNRMNIYVVRQATQGLANWVKTQGGSQTVAISYDSRLKSDVFAKTAAGVLAANGIKVRIYDALMPVPALSFATRYYECNAGIMVTASHNPAKYNGYKAYGPDGCQMTDDAAAIVYDEIQKTDVLTGAKYISFAEGVEQGLGLHQVGVYLRTVGEGAYAGMKGFHVAFDNEVPAVFLGIPVAELKHFLELPLGVDVHQGEGGTTGGKGFFGQTYHDAGVLANAIEHYGIFKLRCHFADDVNGLGFEFLQVAQTIIFCHDSVLFCVLLPIGAVYMSKGRHFSLIMLTFA